MKRATEEKCRDRVAALPCQLFFPSSPARLWTPEIAAKYEALYESKGTVFHRSTKVVKIVEKDGKACGVEIEGGEVLEADIVVVGVGMDSRFFFILRISVFPGNFLSPSSSSRRPVVSVSTLPLTVTIVRDSHMISVSYYQSSLP